MLECVLRSHYFNKNQHTATTVLPNMHNVPYKLIICNARFWSSWWFLGFSLHTASSYHYNLANNKIQMHPSNKGIGQPEVGLGSKCTEIRGKALEYSGFNFYMTMKFSVYGFQQLSHCLVVVVIMIKS